MASMPAPANPDVKWAVQDIKANLPRRQKARAYYDGEHVPNFATRKHESRFSETFKELADNLCDDVVDEPADRTQIDAWTGTKGKEAQEWWDANRGPARSGQTHLHSYRSGDGFVIVWDVNGDGEPRMFVQDPRQMAVRYSATDPDMIEVAAKCWKAPDGKGYRLNLYYGPDADPRDPRGRVEHYYTKGSSNASESGIPEAAAFLPLVRGNPDDPATFVDWLEEHDKPRNPVFHFPNGDLGEYGKSQLHNVYPLQDAHNKLLCDFMVGCEDIALPKRFATGVEAVRDPATGKEVSPFDEGKSLWWTKKGSNDGASMQQFPAPEMGQILSAMKDLRLAIAREGRLPFYSVDSESGGDAPSGLSLLVVEGKLVKLVGDRHRDWGTEWKDLVAFALTWRGSVTEPKDLDLTWSPPETRDEQALLERLVLKKAALGTVVPVAQLAREAGYDDEQLKTFATEKEDETAKALDQAQAAMGGRISPAGPGTPALAPPPPQPPAGAREATPAGGRA